MPKKRVKAANVTVNIKTPKMPKSKPRKTIIREKVVEKESPVVRLLVENFIALQKTFTYLSGRVDSLANQISDLLRLFEITAKNIAEKPELGFEKEFTDKLNAILEQNRVLARGMALISQQTSVPPAPMQMQAQPAMPAFTPSPPKSPLPSSAPAAMPEPAEEYSQSGYQSVGERKPKPLPII